MKKIPSSVKRNCTEVYREYEYLAEIYARKIFGYENSGYEHQDIVQEFRIKLYTSVQSYFRKWEEYEATGRYKPIPILFYLKSAMVSKTNDFIKLFNNKKDEGVSKMSWDEIDVGHFVDKGELSYSFRKGELIINGIDVTLGLATKEQKRCFIMYCQGFSLGKLQKIFSKNFSAKEIIQKQVQSLQLKKSQLYNFSDTKFEYKLYLDQD